MRQYPNANLEDVYISYVREERDSEDGYNFRGEDGWCEPRGLPMELRETIKKHPRRPRATRDGHLGGSSSFAARCLDELVRANVLQVTILIHLQFGRPADVFRCVCLHPCMPGGSGASLNRQDPRTHTPPPHAARVSIERQEMTFKFPDPSLISPAFPICLHRRRPSLPSLLNKHVGPIIVYSH